MLGRGLEPPRGNPHKILNLARLPIPPSEQKLSFSELRSRDGAEGDRTPDLCNAIAALSQLSYSPTIYRTRIFNHRRYARWQRTKRG